MISPVELHQMLWFYVNISAFLVFKWTIDNWLCKLLKLLGWCAESVWNGGQPFLRSFAFPCSDMSFCQGNDSSAWYYWKPALLFPKILVNTCVSDLSHYGWFLYFWCSESNRKIPVSTMKFAYELTDVYVGHAWNSVLADIHVVVLPLFVLVVCSNSSSWPTLGFFNTSKLQTYFN